MLIRSYPFFHRSQGGNKNFTLSTNTDSLKQSHISTDWSLQTHQGTRADMSEDKPADTVETAPAEVNAIPNGKGHEPGEEIAALAKTPPAGDADKWV